MALPFKVPVNFAAASDDELRQVKTDAAAAAKPYVARINELNDEEKTALRELSAAASQADEQLATRAKDKADLVGIGAQFAAIEEEAAKPAEPVAPPAEPVAAPAEPAPVVAEPAAVFAGDIPRARDIAGSAPATNTQSVGTAADPLTYGAAKYVGKFAPADQTKLNLAEFTGAKQLGQALVAQLARYNGVSGFQRDPLLVFEREYPEAMRLHGIAPSEALEFAAIENAVELYKNQTAAAAYCAPSLTLYDLCELETSAGMLPITEMQISRGGIFFTTGPDFASIFNGSGYWNYTEAQVIANTVKPCMEIDCPPFTEKRLRNLGVCITAGILQRRGYPELIARFIRGAMIAHLHRVNAFVIAEMAAGSTLVDLDPIPAGSLVGDVTASGLLAAAEMVAVDMRYRNRLDPMANLETVFPVWAKAQLRADVSRRTGVDMISVTDSDITSWFSDRNLTLRWVYDWQDAYSGVAGGPGTALPGITTFPAAVEFMIYPPGTWVKGVDDTIRLETVYDSTKLSTNQYTALFTEEGVLVAKVCPDSRRVVYPLCPTGATSDLVTRTCA